MAKSVSSYTATRYQF